MDLRRLWRLEALNRAVQERVLVGVHKPLDVAPRFLDTTLIGVRAASPPADDL